MTTAQQQQQIFELRTGITGLQKDVSVFEKYFTKLDTTITKISEVLDEVKQLVALHDNKLIDYHQDFSELKSSLDALNNRITTCPPCAKMEELTEIQKTIYTAKSELTDKIETVKKDSEKELASVKTTYGKRIYKLELWRSLILGGALIIGLLASSVVTSSIARLINPSQHSTTVQLQQSQPPPVTPKQ